MQASACIGKRHTIDDGKEVESGYPDSNRRCERRIGKTNGDDDDKRDKDNDNDMVMTTMMDSDSDNDNDNNNDG